MPSKKTKTTESERMSRIERAIWFVAKSSVPEIVFMASFLLSRYQQNMDFTYPQEMILPIVLFGVLATVVYYSFRLVLKRVFAAHIASLLLLYVLYQYLHIRDTWLGGLVSGLIPGRFETPFTTAVISLIVYGLLAGGIGYGLARLLSIRRLQSLQLPKALMFLVAFLFVSQAIPVATRLWGILPELRYNYSSENPAQDKSKIIAKPNVYYLVFDRYGSEEQLRANLGIDNSQMTAFLANQGFTTRTDAYANYPFTMSSISSTLALGYHTQLKRFDSSAYQTGFPYRSVLNNPPAAQLFKDNGYKYNQVSSWWDFTRIGINADTHPTISFNLRAMGTDHYLGDLPRDIVYKSILSPLLKKGLSVGGFDVATYEQDRNPRQSFEAQADALTMIAASDSSTPQFTFAHVLLPHDPYIYAADGSEPTYDGGRNDWGADETVKYANQLSYLNIRIQELLKTIRTKDPAAVIIVQADEGPYPKEFRGELSPSSYYDPKNVSDDKARQKFGILASYYFPGVDEATIRNEVNSSVNPLRFVLKHYMGYNTPSLPDCHFSNGNKFRVFNYSLMNERLTGQPADPACTSL